VKRREFRTGKIAAGTRRREAGRLAGASADQIRTGHQPEDREGARREQALLIGMRSRGVSWVLACALGDGTRRRCGENGTAEDPGTVRQRVECLDLTSFRRNSECFRRHLKKTRGIVEVKPRFDSVVDRLVDGDA
jgi:hypothetical protein